MAAIEHGIVIESDEPRQAEHDRIVSFLNRKKQFAITPLSPAFVKTTNRKGGISVQWLRVPGAEGYELSVATNAAMTNLQYRQRLYGNKNTSAFVGLGQVASTAFVRVRSFIGDRFSTDVQTRACGLANVTGTASEITAGTETPPAPDIPDDIEETGGVGSSHGTILE